MNKTSTDAEKLKDKATNEVLEDGQNTADLASQEKKSPATSKKVPLVEVFGPTIQGEGALIGQPTYFLRFGLCDYACKMCDSMHAVDPKQVKANAKWLTNSEITDVFFNHRNAQGVNTTRWVTFSGGNPCIHDLTDLCRDLYEGEYKIAVETQGTFCPEWLQIAELVTISPKGPGMGEKLEIDKLDVFMCNMSVWDVQHVMKVVIFDQRDIEIASMLYERYVTNPSTATLNAGQFFLSLGNTFPPHIHRITPLRAATQRTLPELMVHNYLQLWEELKNHPVLCGVRFLPQFHCFLWQNEKGR
jgi:7-carboxy-7-deazaguanine synthase